MVDYMNGTISNCTTTTGISMSDEDWIVVGGMPKEPKIKSQKMEVELCLCSKALWS